MSSPPRSAPRPQWRSGSAEPDLPRLASLVRHVVVTGLAATVAGVLVGGLGGRVVMLVSRLLADERVIGLHTENGNVIGDLTPEGTLALVFFVGFLGGLVGGVLFVVVEPWIRWSGPALGLVLAAVLFSFFGGAVLDPRNADFVILGHPALDVAMFLALFPLFGAAAVWIRRALLARLPAAGSASSDAGMVYGVLVLPGLLAAFVAGVLLVGQDGRLASALALTGGATLAHWTGEMGILAPRWRTVTTVSGFGAMLVAVAVSLPGSVGNVVELLG